MSGREAALLVAQPIVEARRLGLLRAMLGGERVGDVHCAVDYSMTLPYAGENRIGVLGVCNGGGYAVNAALTEHRFRGAGRTSMSTRPSSGSTASSKNI